MAAIEEKKLIESLDFSSSDGSIERQIQKAVANIRQQMSDLELEVCRYISNAYVEFCPDTVVDMDALMTKVQSRVADTDQELKSLQNMLTTLSKENCDQLMDIKHQIDAVDAELKAYSGLALVASLLEHLSDETDVDYVKQAQMFNRLDEEYLQMILKSAASSKGGTTSTAMRETRMVVDGKVLDALKEEITWKKEPLVFNLFRMWENVFRWERDNQACSVSLHIKCIDRASFQQCLEALQLLDLLQQKVEEFSAAFKCKILDVIRSGRCADIVLSGQSDDDLVVDVRTVGSAGRDGEESYAESLSSPAVACDPASLLEKLLVLFERLSKILDFRVGAKDEQVDSADDGREELNLFAMIGRFVGDDLFLAVKEACLIPLVPSSEQDATRFCEIADKCLRLEDTLIDHGFTTERETRFKDMLANRRILMLEKKCETVLGDVRELVVSDLLNAVDVGGDQANLDLTLQEFESYLDTAAPPSSQSSGCSDKAEVTMIPAADYSRLVDCEGEQVQVKIKINTDIEERLSNMFRFPKCKVSESMVKFVNLLTELLDEAVANNESAVAAKIFRLTRDMLDVFLFLTPYYHRERTDGSAEMTALFYNNAHFVAHWLMTAGAEYTLKWDRRNASTASGDDEQFPVRFVYVDYLLQLRQMAADCFAKFIANEKQRLDEILNTMKGLGELSKEANFERCSMALKKVELRLRGLHRQWKNALPSNVMFAVLAQLVDHTIDYLLRCIFAMVDIAESDCQRIHQLLTVLGHQFPKCFTTGEEVVISSYASRWRALMEMTKCLNCSLQSFEDRWASGTGPLAECFSAYQVKQLIRALYQNTSMRAAVLAGIK